MSVCLEYSNQNAVGIVLGILFVVINVISIAFIYYGIKNMLTSHATGLISIKIIYILCILCLQTHMIISSLSAMFLHSKSKCFAVNYLLISVDNYLYMFVLVHLYLLYTQRLKYTYNGTNEQLNDYQYTMLLLLYFVMLGLVFIKIVVHIVGDICTERTYIYIIPKINITLTILFFPIYLISSIILLVMYAKKAVKLLNNSNDVQSRKKNVIIIRNAVKYINCAVIIFITTIIVGCIYSWGVAYFQIPKLKLINVKVILYVDILIIIDALSNIIFLHLQFHYLNKWYIFCCNPFKYEINHRLNKIIVGLQLSTKSETTNTDDTGQSNTNNIPQSNTDTQTSSIVLKGVEITKTDTDGEINPDKLTPYDGSITVTPEKIYICRFFYFLQIPQILT